MARKTRQQAEREAKERRERAAPPPRTPAFPSREPVGPAKPELADVRQPRERGERERPTRVPPRPAVNWWLDPSEQQAIAEQAALIAERELTPPAGQGRLRTRVPPRTDFDPTAPGFMGVRTPTGEALSWQELQELRAAGVTGFQTEKGGIDLSRLSRVPTPPTREELRAPGFMALEDRPAPYSREYMAEGVREFRERMAGHFQVGEAPPEDILRTTTVMAEPTSDPWTGLMQHPLAQERVSIAISPRAAWRFAKARLGLRHILGGGEALADVAVTGLQQTAYWVERGFGEAVLRNMVHPDQYREQQERTARYHELFPKMPGKAEDRKRLADEYQSLYEAIYDPGVAEGIRHRGITELARMAYSPLPNQERAWKRFLDGENPDHVIAEEMDPIDELIGQLLLDPTNYLIGPAIGWAKRGVVASRSAKYWKVATVADPDVLRFMELGTKFSRKGARFGVIPEYLDAFALTRGAMAQKMGDTTQTVFHHLASKLSHDPDALIAALRGVGDETANIAAKIGIESESEGFKIFDAIAKEVVDLDNLDEMESLKDVISPAQYSLLPEAPPKDVNVFNPARFMEELEPVIYSKSRKLLHTELDQYAKWNIPGRTAQAVKGVISHVYLGLNPGYLMRNINNNFSTILVDDMTTLRSVVRYGDDFAERWGLEGIPGYERGLGTMAEIDKGKARLLHKPAAWSEDVASKLVVRHQAEKLYGGLWKAAGADYFPATLREYMPGASDEFVDFMQNVGRDSLTAGEFRKNVDDIYRVMGGEPPISGAAAAIDEVAERVPEAEVMLEEMARFKATAGGSEEELMSFIGGDPEFGERFAAMEARLGHEEALVETRRMLQTAVLDLEDRLSIMGVGRELQESYDLIQAVTAPPGSPLALSMFPDQVPVTQRAFGRGMQLEHWEEAGEAGRLVMNTPEGPVAGLSYVVEGDRAILANTYTESGFRRQGLARGLVDELSQAYEGRVTYKGPVSKQGLALMDELGIPMEPPGYPFSIDRLDPGATIPHNVKAEMQGIVDELVETGDEVAFQTDMTDLRHDVAARTRLTELKDSMFWDMENDCLVLGSQIEGIDDLPEPIHFFYRGPKRLERKLGMPKAESQKLYAQVIKKTTGADVVLDVSDLKYSHLSDEQQVHYVRELLGRLGKKEELRDFEKAYLAVEPEKWMHLVRSPADVAAGPLPEDELLDLMAGFREAAIDKDVRMVDNGRIAKMMGFEGEDAEKAAQQLADELYKYGGLGAAESRSGLRPVMFKPSDGIEFTREDALNAHIKVQEEFLGQRWEGRMGATGGRLTKSDHAMLQYNREKLAWLKGEADDIPMLKNLVSPLEAEPMGMAEAGDFISAMDEVVGPEAAGAMATLPTDELEAMKEQHIGAMTDWLGKIEFIDEEAGMLPTYRDAQRYWNKHTGEVILSPKGGAHDARVKWDVVLPEWQSRYPIDDWYRGSVGEAVYMKVDEDLFRDIVERRMAIRADQKRLARLVEGAEERVNEIDGILQQRAIEQAKRAVPLEGRDIYLRGIRDDLASGQMSVDDIDSILSEGGISAEEAQEFKAFHETHWKLQDEQNRILEEEILRRQRASLEQRPLGPEGMPEEIGTSREFAYMEARQAGPSTFGGSRVSDAYRGQEVYIDDIIHRAMTEVPDGVKKPPAPPSDFTDESYEALMRWADEQADPAREGAKIVAETNAVAMRDFALLDYSQRRNFDLWGAMLTPYHYWYTRSGFNWMQRMATKPWAFNANVRAQRALKQVNKDLPSRLRTSVGVPAPILKEWMGDKLYIDPFRNLAAFNNLYPWAGMTQFDYDDPVEAQNGFQEWGDLFDRVQMRPFFYMDLPRRALSGEWSDTYYQMPMTAGMKGTTALMREAGVMADTGDTPFIPPGGFNIEAKPREWAGMPRAYFTEETYWPMQHLAMMVALGETSEDEARKAWYDKLILGQDSEMWDAAYQRGGVQRGVSQFGSFWLGQPFNIYPKGEDLMRGWSAELDELGYIPEERPEGTAAERFEYWETHPALRLRSDAFAMMGEKAWMYKDEDGKVDVEAYKRARDEWLAKGGGVGALEQRYKLGEYGKAKDNIDIQWMGVQNDLIDEGMVPGTKAYEIADEWFREYVRDPLYERYKEYFDGADEPPYRASPEEQEAWWTERRARELASVYYDVEPEAFQDPDGNTDWDAFYAARKEALNTLPPDERLEVERYIHRNRIPEEEAMWAIEERVYQPIRDLIGEISDMEDAETKKQLQAELDAVKERADEATVDALVDELERVLELHPDWGEEQVGRYAAFDIPSYDTWARKGYEPRQAFDQAFRTFYWSLSSGVRSTLRDEDRARKAGLPDNYLGPEFEEYEEGHHKLEDFDELPDDQVLDWLAKVGQIVQLEAEGFPIPGRDVAGALTQIPGYEQLARGEDFEWEVEGQVGAALYPQPRARPGIPAEKPVEQPGDFDTETERLTALMQEASAEIAVQGEETAEIDLVEPTFQLPEEATQARIEKAYTDMDAWVAGGEEGDWTEEMEWWFGDPDSPKSQFWSTYGMWRAPKEENPLGWGLLPRELKDNPFVSMVFDAMDDEDADVSEDVYIEAKLAIDEFVEEHGEELMQAREEFIGYLGTLNPEIEKLQDQYYEFPAKSKERRDFAQQHPELVAYWEQKREYKNSHPLMVQYYFPGTTVGTTYQRRGWGGGGGGGRRGAEADGWQQFTEAAGPEIIGALIDYWGGTRPLSDADRQYLVSLFKRYRFGAGNFEAWLSLLQQMWQKSLGGGEYEIPMRKHGIVVGEGQKQQGTSRWPTAPSRVRYLGRRG